MSAMRRISIQQTAPPSGKINPTNRSAPGTSRSKIPLVQCLGHAEYLLKHHACRHLAEDENLQQLCPSNPDALAFFAGMADEVRKAHPGIRYFHIGGDESGSLGNCPQCSAVAEARGKNWMARGRRLGERKYLHAARESFQAAGEAVLEVCAVYELLLQETAMVERNNAWHLYYLEDSDPTRLRSRADTAAQLADLHRRWQEWEVKAEAALRHELQPAGLAELIGTKSSGPLEKIAWLMRRLSGEQ